MRYLITALLIGLLALARASAGGLAAVGTDVAVTFESTAANSFREAGRSALDKWARDFATNRPNRGRIAVLPLTGDFPDEYMTETLRHALSRLSADAGTSIYARDEAICRQLLAEIRRGDRSGDTMEIETIQKFGRISGVELLAVGRVAGVASDPEWESTLLRRLLGQKRSLSVRFVGSVYEVETGRLMWGGERTGAVDNPEVPWRIPGSPRGWGLAGISALGAILLWITLCAVRRRYRPL